jgi:hypothetical protein
VLKKDKQRNQQSRRVYIYFFFLFSLIVRLLPVPDWKKYGHFLSFHWSSTLASFESDSNVWSPFSFVPYFQDWDGENHLQYHYLGISVYKYNIGARLQYNDHLATILYIENLFLFCFFLFWNVWCSTQYILYVYVYFSHSFCDFIKMRSPCRRLKKSTFLISL